MAYRLVEEALNTSLPQTQRFVLAVICTYANQDGVAYPSYATIAQKTGLSRRQIIRLVQALEQSGHVTIDRTRGRSRTNFFRVRFQRKGDMSRKKVTNRTKKGDIAMSPDPSGTVRGGSRDFFRDDLHKLEVLYRTLPGGLSSPIRSPSRYFQKLRSTRSELPPASPEACLSLALAAQEALPGPSLTFPPPHLLPGLEQAAHAHNVHQLGALNLRLALYQFLRADDGGDDVIDPTTLLSRIASRPTVFAEALRLRLEALG